MSHSTGALAAETAAQQSSDEFPMGQKNQSPQPAHEVAPWPITDAMIDAAAPYCQSKSRDLAHTALAAARNASPPRPAIPSPEGAPAPTAEDRTRALNLAHQFRSHPASRGLDDIEQAGEIILALLAETAPAEAHGLPRLAEWDYRSAHGHWRNGVPDWARDLSGQIDDGTAKNAVIAELRAALSRNPQPKGAVPEPAVSNPHRGGSEAYLATEHWNEGWNACRAAMLAAVQAPAPAQTPIGYITLRKLQELQSGKDCAMLAIGATADERMTEPLYTAVPSSPAVAHLTDEQKRKLVTGWFSETWAIDAALGLLHDYEVVRSKS